MRLVELFDQPDEAGSVVQEMRDAILDMLVPLAANGVPSITIQAVIDKMREQHSGIVIDRALVMHVLDPQQVAMITKIEGDTVFFKVGDGQDRKVSDDEAEKDEKHVKSTALKQAKKSVAKKSTAPKTDTGGDSPL